MSFSNVHYKFFAENKTFVCHVTQNNIGQIVLRHVKFWEVIRICGTGDQNTKQEKTVLGEVWS